VLEDCCQAGGATYKGQRTGTFGEMGAFSLNYFKTFTAGDGGLLATNSDELYEVAFGYHDQGHRPLRTGVEVGRRTIMGMNFRMNELTGAVALAQLRKLSHIVETLRDKKRKFKESLQGTPGVTFRRITDPNGECATLLVMFLPTAARARDLAKELGTKPLCDSGWHVYSNMEHILARLNELGHPVKPGSLPRTDDLLARAINLSVGVVDSGLGSAFGINIHSSDQEILKTAERVRQAVAAVVR
jgi:8-amino-3,8-dideoxy-alpha-D-manno-octulosonate transaminase